MTLLMFWFRCVHPPSGAVAITAVLGGSTVHALGYAFVLFPVGINSLALLAAAIVYHRLTGHRYPHHASTKTPPLDHEATEMFTRADLDAVLRRRSEILDVDAADLEWMLKEIARESHRRRVKSPNPS
ncbi:HPP family protein [Massilia sp. S19_KUP03_FR1]|uniref:HPP family protein n=1 Tax=Massilia sp. S19_KUP03_FR1 TaxID=3025503 RepID=UPI002FCD7BF1